MKGTLVNAAAILAGSGVGWYLKRGLPVKYQDTVMHGIGMAVGLIGLQMALKTNNVLIVIISLVIGGIMGEKLNIDGALNRLGERITDYLGEKHGDAGRAFVTASLVYCVGAMAVVGSLQDGLTGEAGTLYAKSMLDGITAVIFTSGMGIGVALSSIPVLIYQGGITLTAGLISPYLSPAVITEMTAVGGLLIVAISLLLLKISAIRVANLLPAILIAAVIAGLWPA